MKTCLLCLLCFLSCHALSAQVAVSGSVKNYKSDYFRITTESPFQLATHNDTLWIKEGRFYLDTLFDGTVAFTFLPGHMTLFLQPYDTVQFDIIFPDHSSSADNIRCQFSGANAPGHQLLFEFKSIPEYYYLEELYHSLEKEKDPDLWLKKIKHLLKEKTAPFLSALNQGQISPVFFKTATEMVQITLLLDILRQIDEDVDSSDPDQMDLEEKIRLVEQLFTTYSHLIEEGYSFGKQYLFVNTYHAFQNARENEEKSLFLFTNLLSQVADLTCKLPISVSKFLDQNKKSLAELFWAQSLYINFHVFSENPELFEQDYRCFKAQFPNSKFVSLLDEKKNE